jgi:type IV pilus assembly protein PilW
MARRLLRRSRGVTLVELLVAVAIGLIATVAIFQVFAAFEGQKRTTASGGEAQTNGALALFTLERELRQAGYGINNTDYLGCNILGWDELTGSSFTFTFAPVRITQGAGGAPDTIAITYGNGALVPNPANIAQNMASPVAPFQVNNRYGFRAGDLVVAAETGKDCSLRQVSQLPTGAGQESLVVHASGSYTDPDTGAVLATRYNNPAGSGVVYTFNGKLFNLGPRPASNVYSVQNGQLVVQQLLSAPSTAATPLFDGIVQLQAQYGRDTNGDGIVDVFDEFVPASAADWATILAVRIAIVARSGLYEREIVSPPTIKLWPDSSTVPITVGPVWTLTPDEQHYRYKVFTTVVPVRNMLWRP